MSIAASEGVAQPWSNPALSAYDGAFRYAIMGTTDQELSGFSIASAVQTRGFGIGIHNFRTRDNESLWSLSSTTSIRLPKQLAAGLLIQWRLVGPGRNFVSYDAGIAWRPLPWLGFGAVTYNIGNPDPAAGMPTRSGLGVAVRPFSDKATFSLDYLHTFQSDPAHVLELSTRIQPRRGLFLRASIDNTFQFGAGLEVYFDGVGTGAHVARQEEKWLTSLWIDNAEPGQSLVRSKRVISSLALNEVPSLESRRTFFSPAQHTWPQILEQINHVRNSSNSPGLLIRLDDIQLSWARCDELRQLVADLESRDKRVLVYLGDNASTRTYWVASAASQIVMHPAATLDLTGVSRTLIHLRGLMDLVGLRFQVARRSEYKSAVETNTQFSPSTSSLEQENTLLDDFYSRIVEEVATGRDVELSEVEGWVARAPFSAHQAKQSGAIDQVVYPDQIDAFIDEYHGKQMRTRPLRRFQQTKKTWLKTAQIAVISVDGIITSGDSSPGGLLGTKTSGDETVCRQLQAVAKDHNIRAVVLRVNSPGGSAFASDQIWRCTQLVQQQGKPLVVSMGGVAASGGYYVSAGADAIWAEPTTITGSIGVYVMVPLLNDLFEKTGVQITTLNRGGYSDLYSTSNEWDAAERERVEALVEGTYTQFKDRVALGRRLRPEQVEEIAKGRVWSGARAHEIGLVDKLGGLLDAIDDARLRAGIPRYRPTAIVSFTASGSILSELPGPLLNTEILSLRRDHNRVIAQLLGAEIPESLHQLLRPLAVAALFQQDMVWMIASNLTVEDTP